MKLNFRSRRVLISNSDANAQFANQYSYNSYGQRLTSVESVPQPYGWKGRDVIPGPNIYYNRARFYDPVLGRFTTEDPIGYAAGGFNNYLFAFDSPLRWIDPTGLAAVEEGSTLGVATSATVGSALIGAGLACTLSTITSALQAIDGVGSSSNVIVEVGQCAVCCRRS